MRVATGVIHQGHTALHVLNNLLYRSQLILFKHRVGCTIGLRLCTCSSESWSVNQSLIKSHSSIPLATGYYICTLKAAAAVGGIYSAIMYVAKLPINCYYE